MTIATSIFAAAAALGSDGVPEDPLPAALPSWEGLVGLADSPPVAPASGESSALGRALFFDPILSADRSVACASCHRPEHGFSSPERFPAGAAGRRALRNAPTLYNRAYGRSQMWDGRFSSLEEQVVQPIQNENEMGLPLAEAVARLRAEPRHARRFQEVFGGEVTEEHLARALAAFVGNLYLGGSPVDRFRAGDRAALTPEETTGLWVYESKGRCWRCHGGPNFSDESFHNTGVGSRDGVPEAGRFAVTGREEDRGRFKTPTLRGVANTAPYMHDGSLETLEDVVRFYASGGVANSHLDPLLQPVELSEAEAAGLAAFLRALSRGPDS